MSDSNKPTVSEIRARPQCLCPWNPPSEKDYLLDLVERLGKALGLLVGKPAVFACGYCIITVESNGSITHEEFCVVPKARALLLEFKE